MPKKAPTPPPLPRRLQDALSDAHDLMTRGRWAQIIERLSPLAADYPKVADVHKFLYNAHLKLRDYRGCLHAAEALAELEPRAPGTRLILGLTYGNNGWPALALRELKEFLRRWPQHPEAARTREGVAALQADVEARAAETGPGEEGHRLVELLEETQAHLQGGRYARVKQTAAEALRHKPDFAAVLNNLTQALALEGNPGEAVATAERVLAFAPDNIHALSNRARCLVLSGRLAEAAAAQEALLAHSTPMYDVWIKKAEALAYLADDAAMLQLFAQVPEEAPERRMGMLWHYAAVSALFLGQEAEARRWWQEAVRLEPGLTLARDNLADLERPAHDRHGPWPVTLNYWVSAAIAQELARAARNKRDDGLRAAVRQVLAQHPEITALAPRLLERGGRESREFIMMLAKTAATPELLEAVRAFALGQRGPDQMRMEAAQVAAEHGLLPRQGTTLWLNGAQQTVFLMGFQLYGEPTRAYEHSPQVERWFEASHTATLKGDWATAEPLLVKALQAEPDKPDLLFNLSAIYAATGREAEAEAIWQRIHAAHPDYLFARTALARQAALRGEAKAAHDLLEPLLRRSKLHFSEFASLAIAEIEVCLAEDKKEGAASWLTLWEDALPDDTRLAHYRQLLKSKPERPRWPPWPTRRHIRGEAD